MRFPARAPRNFKQLALLVSATAMLLALAAPGVARAVAAPASTAVPSVAQDTTTAPATATTAPTTPTSAPATVTTAPTATSGQPGASSTTPSTAAGAQAGATAVVPPVAGLSPLNPGWTVDQMGVQVWPEYDQNAVLVLMTLTLPADVQLPATFKFAIPHGAEIAGIGEVDPNGQFKYNYANSYPPVQSGTEWDVATIQVKDYKLIQIDYYYNPGLPTGAGDRSFPVLFQVPVDVASLNLHIQQPSRATNFKVQPDLQSSGKAQDGFTYAVGAFTDVKAGSTIGEVVSYSKPDGNPSTGASEDATPAKLKTSTVLLVAILIIVVCVGGVVIYMMYRSAGKAKRTGRGGRPQRRAVSTVRQTPTARQATSVRQRPPARAKVSAPTVVKEDTESEILAESSPEGPVKPASFCVSCGEELGPKNRFCPNCGEAVDS